MQQDLKSNNLMYSWMKQLTWLRIVHSGDWCLRLALRTPSEVKVKVRVPIVNIALSQICDHRAGAHLRFHSFEPAVSCRHSPIMWAVGYTSPSVTYVNGLLLLEIYSFYRPRRDGWLSWPCWLTDSRGAEKGGACEKRRKRRMFFMYRLEICVIWCTEVF